MVWLIGAPNQISFAYPGFEERVIILGSSAHADFQLSSPVIRLKLNVVGGNSSACLLFAFFVLPKYHPPTVCHDFNLRFFICSNPGSRVFEYQFTLHLTCSPRPREKCAKAEIK